MIQKKCIYANVGKIYKFHSGLYRHKNNCNYNKLQLCSEDKLENIIIATSDVDISGKNEIISKQSEQIKELIETVREMIPKIGNTVNNTQNKFNLNVFLNEQCKDAMNLSEFIKNIKMEYADLDYTVENGLENSIANVFIRNLKELDQCKRPIHCTDAKRHVLFIKENDKWEKDCGHEKMIKGMHFIKEKHVDTLCGWQGEFPECWNTKNKLCDVVMHYTSKTCAELSEKAKGTIVNKIARSIPPIKKK